MTYLGSTLAEHPGGINERVAAKSDLDPEQDLEAGVGDDGLPVTEASETSRNPYKWEDEPSATFAWSDSESTGLADPVTSLGREGTFTR